jgi:hypothetical protein
MNNFSILSLVSGVLLMSYSLRAVFSLLFESPFFELQKYLKYYFQINEREKINNRSYIIVLNGHELKE